MADVTLPLEHVYAEPRESTDGPTPAVFVLHGRGADETDLLPVARHLPDELAAVSLRAPEQLMGGYTWYEIDMPDGDLHRSQPDPDDFRRSLDLIAGSVDAAIDSYDLDPDRIGLLGFSQGAITSFSLLLRDPTFAWVVGLHGYLAEEHADLRPDGIEGTPVFVGAGGEDQIIPASRARAAADRLREIGCAVEFEVYGGGHEIGREELEDAVSFVENQFE